MHENANGAGCQRQGRRHRFDVAPPVIAAILFIAGLVSAAPASAAPKTLLLYGDSLMAGYGVAPADAFATKLQAALDKGGLEVKIVNASVSGDTTADGVERFDWSVPQMPDAAILELGANDMLRGQPVEAARKNLSALLDRFSAAHVPVLLAGMMADRALGADYVTAFDAMYPDLARQYDAGLYPFFLQHVALDPDLNQADRLHPNAKGVDVIVENITPFVVALLQRVEPAQAATAASAAP